MELTPERQATRLREIAAGRWLIKVGLWMVRGLIPFIFFLLLVFFSDAATWAVFCLLLWIGCEIFARLATPVIATTEASIGAGENSTPREECCRFYPLLRAWLPRDEG